MNPEYNFAFLDEGSKREIRRSILKAVAVPGYQVPFGSRELPIGRGWGTGGIQLTLSLIGPRDVLKVIDQGSDDSVNAVNIKKFINLCSDVATTTDSTEATLIQTRHRIPEEPLRNDQLLVFQVPLPEPLRARFLCKNPEIIGGFFAKKRFLTHDNGLFRTKSHG